MKKNVLLCAIIGIVIVVGISFQKQHAREPITITVYASEAELSTNDLITMADVIAIGDFIETYPSRWSTSNGLLPENATLETVSRQRLSIFTDSSFRVSQNIKGNSQKQALLVRTMGGQVGEDKMIFSGSPTYEFGKTYLLFLFLETGPTAKVVPGAYYGTSSPYQIIDGKAISIDDEWVLEDLIAYIEKSLSSETPVSTESPALPTETLLPPTETPIFTEAQTATP